MEIMQYVLAAVPALGAIIIFFMVRKRAEAKKLRQKLIFRWGRTNPEKYRAEDMTAIKSYFDNLHEAEPERFFLDDITWNDLDMDNIFKRVNNTQSTVGEEYHYALLREPVANTEVLAERSRLAEHFRNNREQRLQLQYYLARLGKVRFAGVSNYFFSKAGYKSFRRRKYIFQLIAFLLSPVVIAANPSVGILLLIASFFYNMTTYYKSKNELSAQLDTMSYLVNLITYSKKIGDSNFPGLEEYAGRLKRIASAMKGTSTKSFYRIFYNTQDPFFEYFKILFLVELIAFESINKKISKHRKELRLLFETVGLLDSMISVASFRESVPFYTVPVYSAPVPGKAGSDKGDSGKDRSRKTSSRKKAGIFFTDIYHPLIEEPVTNSANISRPVLVTGSNASGKSTFLKTVAINAVFAQTIATCLAKKYETGVFRIFTSMALRDDLQSSESYYIAEIKSLKRILDSLNDQIPLFCVIDEVLRGTNTIERIAASSEVMRYLAGENCLCMTATHDIELVSILEGLFDNYHFRESFQDNNISFDYKLYPGKSNTRNAIKLLEIMGYPESTVKAARNTAERFEREGGWTPDGSAGQHHRAIPALETPPE